MTVDKNFTSNDRDDADCTAQQERLLTLLDGLAASHKLFVATANSVGKLNKCMLDRPGRFRYHLRFGPPSIEDVREFIGANMTKEMLDERIDDVKKLIRLHTLQPKTLDCIKTIVDEMSYGMSLSDAMSILNIGSGSGCTSYRLRVDYSVDGKSMSSFGSCDEVNMLEPNPYNDLDAAVRHKLVGTNGRLTSRIVYKVFISEKDIVDFGTIMEGGSVSLPLEKVNIERLYDANPVMFDDGDPNELREDVRKIYEDNEKTMEGIKITGVTVVKEERAYHIDPALI